MWASGAAGIKAHTQLCTTQMNHPTVVSIHPVGLQGSACHYCCHTFTGPMVGIPLRFKPEQGLFYCTPQVFCSFGCALTYLRHHGTHFEKMRAPSLLSMMYRRMGGSRCTFPKPSPHRSALKMFGGVLDIEEFRAASLTETKIELTKCPVLFENEFILLRKKSDVPIKQEPVGPPVAPRITDSNILGFLKQRN